MKTSFFSILFLTLGIFSHSQNVSKELLSNSGEQFSSSNYIINWSIGECVTATLDTNAYHLSQGFHQSMYEISMVEDLNPKHKVTIYPNPTRDFINIAFADTDKAEKQIIITNNKGIVLFTSQTENKKEKLNFTNYTDGVYFLTIQRYSQKIKTFKIIKK